MEYLDIGVSGTKDSRPVLNRLMADCRRGKIDKVIVWRFDRAARSVAHLLRILDEFRELRIDFISICESIDTSTATGKLMFTIIGAMAEFERSLIVERVRAGQKAARARGKHIGRRASYNAEQAAQIATLRGSGMSVRLIASQLGLGRSTVQRVLSA
jgi:DNA invertase Pin-like site-specific DNA recombinase